MSWIKVGNTHDFPENGGANVKIDEKQIAVFNFTRRGEWFATQNLCPHKKEMILSRGMLGSKNDEPKVACPFHKKNFSLKTGECMGDDEYKIEIYPIKVEKEEVFIEL